MAAPTYNPPKLPFFSGSAEPNKGEASYEVWQYEVKCLQKADGLPESVILHSIHSSLRGAAREHLIPMGEDAFVDEILHKLDDFYGNVSTAESIYNHFIMISRKRMKVLLLSGLVLNRHFREPFVMAIWNWQPKIQC